MDEANELDEGENEEEIIGISQQQTEQTDVEEINSKYESGYISQHLGGKNAGVR